MLVLLSGRISHVISGFHNQKPLLSYNPLEPTSLRHFAECRRFLPLSFLPHIFELLDVIFFSPSTFAFIVASILTCIVLLIFRVCVKILIITSSKGEGVYRNHSVRLSSCPSVRFCPDNNSWTTQSFLTRLGMLVYYHGAECLAEKMVHYL